MSLGLEYCKCPLCTSESLASKEYHFSPYRVVQCASCGLWYLNPRLSEENMLAQYASDTYFSGSDGVNEGYSDYASQEKALRPTFRRFLAYLNKQGMCGGDLLEVGCGYGYLLSEAAPYFDKRYATDFSQGAIEQAQHHADRVYCGGVDAIPDGDMFDCIISVEVIEHIYEPCAFLESLYGRLKPGGSLILATPDMGSFWRRWMGHKWPSFKLPEHVTYYDASTLTTLYRKVGFEHIQAVPFPHAFPLSVFLEKLGLSVLPCPKANIWFPQVVLAMSAKKPND